MTTKDRLLTPGEVAGLFRVDPKTVTRWAARGKLVRLRTPGGHSRFRESEVRALLASEGAGDLLETEAADVDADDFSDLLPASPEPRQPPRIPVAPDQPPAEVVVRNNRGW